MTGFMSTAALASASEETATATGQQPSLFESMIPMLLIFVVMYFIIIRPQAKKAKDHASLLKNIKEGDEVVTSGGIIGRVRSVSDSFVSLDLGGSTIKVMKEHISRFSKPQSAKQTQAPVKASKNLKKATQS